MPLSRLELIHPALGEPGAESRRGIRSLDVQFPARYVLHEPRREDVQIRLTRSIARCIPLEAKKAEEGKAAYYPCCKNGEDCDQHESRSPISSGPVPGILHV